jgi:hypothetical protein
VLAKEGRAPASRGLAGTARRGCFLLAYSPVKIMPGNGII